MKYDIILAGVGGQGGLSVSVVIATAAMEEGLQVKQSEVHGMSQRGGAVLAHLRLSDREIASPMIPEGGASLLMSFEPLEGLRYLPWMSPQGTLVTATQPVKNIPDYPELDQLLSTVRSVPKAKLIDADKMAREAGSARAANMVLVGTIAHLLPLKTSTIENAIRKVFASKGEKIVETNLKAFKMGQQSPA